MLLKAFTLLVVAFLVATFFLRLAQVKHTAWIMVGSLIVLGLLAIQILRGLDTLLR